MLQHSLPLLAGYTIRADALMRAQTTHGLDVVALTGAVERSGSGDQEVIKGIRHYRTQEEIAEKRRGLREWKLYRSLKSRLHQVAMLERPDIIHVHSPAYNAMAALSVASRLGVPCVYEVRALWEDAAVDRGKVGHGSLAYRAAQAFENRIFSKSDAVVTICQGLWKEVVARGVSHDKVFIAPNGVEADAFSGLGKDTELASRHGLDTGPVFGFIGSLFRYEGVEDLIEAFQSISAEHPTARLLIVGGGEREQEVRTQIAAANSKAVVHCPRVAHAEVPKFYSIIDCLVYPRRKMRLTDLVTPLKPLEAMAMGKLVIASDVGGHRELLEDGKTGLLYEAGDNAALARVLCRVAQDPNLLSKLAQAGRSYVQNERSWGRTTQGHLAAYEKVLRHTISEN